MGLFASRQNRPITNEWESEETTPVEMETGGDLTLLVSESWLTRVLILHTFSYISLKSTSSASILRYDILRPASHTHTTHTDPLSHCVRSPVSQKITATLKLTRNIPLLRATTCLLHQVCSIKSDKKKRFPSM